MYYIKNGKLASIRTKTSGGTYEGMGYTARPKVIGKNLYQTMDYSNAEDAGFYFKTYSFNPNTGIMTHTKTKSYINNQWELGSSIYKKWSSNPSYMVK